MSLPPKLNNGEYALLTDDPKSDNTHKVTMYLGADPSQAVDSMKKYLKNNPRMRPNAWLVQVVAVSHYPEPIIKTTAHERMR
jgi:hypothetical protein